MLNFHDVTKTACGAPIFSNASFQIYRGEKVGLVGPNGSGKTTIYDLITGRSRPDSGAISFESGSRLAYFSQRVAEMRGRSALEEVMGGNARALELAARLREHEAALCDPAIAPDEMERVLAELGDDQHEFEKIGGFGLESDAQVILTGLGIHPDDHGRPLEEFSSGWKMRIALARVLVTAPDLILMDEPTNYLDMETILWLEEWLVAFKGAVLLTTHDRDFMNRVVKKIVEVSFGGVVVFSGNYDFYEQEKTVRKRHNEAAFDRQQAMLKKEEDFIARFKARASHAAQVQSRVKMIDKIERVELLPETTRMRIELPDIPRGGNDVAVIRGLAKSYKIPSGEKQVFSGLSAVVRRCDRVAVAGVNGAGKSTFLRVLCGIEPPGAGEAVIGPSVSIGYFGQSTVESLDPQDTIFGLLQRKLPDANDGALRNLLAAFLFSGEEVFKKLGVLSGGEKTRVILSYLLTTPYNCLVLDEPTNHLDIGSRAVLLDTLQRYQGTLLFVSHDRYFLRALATRVFEVEAGRISVFDCDYARYLEEKRLK